MIDHETHQPIRVSVDGDAGPYLMVVLEQLNKVKELLVEHGVRFSVAEDAVQLDGHPVVAVVDFGREADAGHIQQLLDQAA